MVQLHGVGHARWRDYLCKKEGESGKILFMFFLDHSKAFRVAGVAMFSGMGMVSFMPLVLHKYLLHALYVS